MIPDDHDIVDDTFVDNNINNKQFTNLYKIFNKFITNFTIDLRFKYNGEDLSYIIDKKNDTIYILNYDNNFNLIE